MTVIGMRPHVLFWSILAFAYGTAAQAEDRMVPEYLNKPVPKFDFETKSIKPDGSIWSGIDLRGSSLNIETDRKPTETLAGVENFEAGTLVVRKSHKRRPFLGLSIQTPIE